jgi:hypothetical protein
MIGVPISMAFSNPLITPEENICHPRPITAKMITSNKIKLDRPICSVL